MIINIIIVSNNDYREIYVIFLYRIKHVKLIINNLLFSGIYLMQDAQLKLIMNNSPLKNHNLRYEIVQPAISITSVYLPHHRQSKNTVIQPYNSSMTRYRPFRQYKQQERVKNQSRLLQKERLRTVQCKRQNDINDFLDDYDPVQIIKLKLYKNDEKGQRERLKTDFTVYRHNKSFMKHYYCNNNVIEQKAMNFTVKHIPKESKVKEKVQQVVIDLNSNFEGRSLRAKSVTSRKNDTFKINNNRVAKKEEMIHYTSHNFQKKLLNTNRSTKTQQIFNKYDKSKILPRQISKNPEAKFKPSKNHFLFAQGQQLSGWQIKLQPPENQIIINDEPQNTKRRKKIPRRFKKKRSSKTFLTKQ